VQQADERLQVVTQSMSFTCLMLMIRIPKSVSSAMSVIRMIKLFGWEEQMEGKIAEKRDGRLKPTFLFPYITDQQRNSSVNGRAISLTHAVMQQCKFRVHCCKLWDLT
jgi:hypothetical protein